MLPFSTLFDLYHYDTNEMAMRYLDTKSLDLVTSNMLHQCSTFELRDQG